MVAFFIFGALLGLMDGKMVSEMNGVFRHQHGKQKYKRWVTIGSMWFDWLIEPNASNNGIYQFQR